MKTFTHKQTDKQKKNKQTNKRTHERFKNYKRNEDYHDLVHRQGACIFFDMLCLHE